MILRRLTTALRKQDWVTVVIETLIVVLGVFLGLQVNNWNADRLARNELDASLRGVAQDFSNTVWHRTDQINWIDDRLAGMELMLAALDGRELTPEEQRNAYRAMTAIPAPPPDPGRYAALSELQNDGLMNRIESQELRSALSEVLSSRSLISDFYKMSLRRLTAPDFSPDSTTYGLISSGDGQPASSTEIISVDLEAARADPLFRRRIIQGHAVFRTARQTLKDFRQVDCEVLKMLQAEGFTPSGHWLIEQFRNDGGDPSDSEEVYTCEAGE